MLGIGKELMIFLEAVLSGITVLASYQVLRVARRLVRHGLFAVTAEDFLFWLGTSCFLFYEIYETCDGSIRWYFVIGVMSGILIFAGIMRMFQNLYTKVERKLHKKDEKVIEKTGKKG